MGLAANRMTPTRSVARAARRPEAVTAIGLVAAVAAGALLVVAPVPAFGAVAAGALLVLMAVLGRRSAPAFLIPLGTLLIAYAMAGRGIAYVGTGSLFVGEGVLFLGVIAFILNIDRARFGVVHWLIVAFMVIGLVRTVPYIGGYGPLALRDGVVWGYAAFALAVSTTFESRWLEQLVRVYRAFVPIFLLWVPVATAITIMFADRLPGWPGAPVPIIVIKQGDFGVHLAGIAAFVLVGLYAARRSWVPSWAVWGLFFLDLAIIAAVTRGGLVAVGLGAASALLFVRSGPRLVTAGGIALAGFVLLYAINPVIDVGSTQGRELSFSQLVDNVVSVVGASDSGNLQGTKEWRLNWWNVIIDYTVNGDYFWTGKGFGINLADSDGFQVLADHSLRAPHNGHIALLARGGVPLIVVWGLIQVAFAIGLFRASRRALAAGRTLLVQVAGWTFALWVAALINMTFDVYLEGPQGGIWFWSLIGLGLVVMRAAGEPDDDEDPAMDPGGRPDAGLGRWVEVPPATSPQPAGSLTAQVRPPAVPEA